MHPPFVLLESGDVTIFNDVEQIEAHLEPIDVKNDEYHLYDSTGQILEIKVVESRLPGPLGIVGFSRQRVIVSESTEPVNEPILRAALVKFLERRGLATGINPASTLEQLLEASKIQG
jgi:hypothetical protein